MLVVTPDTLYGRLGALLSALIVVFSLIGLTMHRDFYAGKPRRDFYCFYTNLSNLLVLIYFALAAPRLYAGAQLRPLIPHAEFSLMMSIMLTFCVFHLLLFPAVRERIAQLPVTREYRIVCTDNFIIHYLVPWLVFFYWLFCSPQKSALHAADAFTWTLFPLLYIGFVFLRASKGRIIEETQSPYPYPFLDVQVFGVKRVGLTCAKLYGLCAAAGLLSIAVIRLAFAIFREDHALILI